MRSDTIHRIELELFVLTWGIYPRRILIYLAEKGLLQSPAHQVAESGSITLTHDSFNLKITPVTIAATENSMELAAPGKPPGTVPILAIGNGQFIMQSIAILEYLEDICDAARVGDIDQTKGTIEMEGNRFRTMRGTTINDRARTRDILALADEASTFFGFGCHKGTALFTQLEVQSVAASVMALESSRRALEKIEGYYEGDHRFEVIGEQIGRDSTIADCVLFSLLQFSKELYGKDLIAGLPNLRRFYKLFKLRDSAKIPEEYYPEQLKSMAEWNNFGSLSDEDVPVSDIQSCSENSEDTVTPEESFPDEVDDSDDADFAPNMKAKIHAKNKRKVKTRDRAKASVHNNVITQVHGVIDLTGEGLIDLAND